jgi:hypothetical protein
MMIELLAVMAVWVALKPKAVPLVPPVEALIVIVPPDVMLPTWFQPAAFGADAPTILVVPVMELLAVIVPADTAKLVPPSVVQEAKRIDPPVVNEEGMFTPLLPLPDPPWQPIKLQAPVVATVLFFTIATPCELLPEAELVPEKVMVTAAPFRVVVASK